MDLGQPWHIPGRYQFTGLLAVSDCQVGKGAADIEHNDPLDAVVGAIDTLHGAISHMQDVLRHPQLPRRIGDSVEVRRKRAVQTIMQIRDIRDQGLGGDLFSDPAWNILLDAYASSLEGRMVSVSDACIAARAPYTTSLRWLRVLEKRGLIVREDDRTDRRRVYVRLTTHAREKVEALIDQIINDIAPASPQRAVG
jgi:DNA-binding transcriptional ArsR family regulator